MLPGFAVEGILSMKNRRRINGVGAEGPSSNGYLFLLLFILSDVFFIAPSAACFNGNCQVTPRREIEAFIRVYRSVHFQVFGLRILAETLLNFVAAS